jgi:hypothetical protein
MHAQQHAKNHFKFFKASDQAELRPNPCRTRHQAGRWCTQLQILLSACQISKSQNFHNFLNFHQPKGCFLSDRQKSPEFYPIKKVFFSKGYSCKKKKKKSTLPASTADPKKVKKVEFFFCQFFLHFWLRLLDAVQKCERLMVRK